MRSIVHFVLIAVYTGLGFSSLAQEERLVPLYGYPQLYPEKFETKREGLNNAYVFLFDTLDLPFRDDFTKRNIKDYSFDLNDPGVSFTPYYFFTIGGAFPAIFEAMYDTSYNYTYNTSTLSWDSVANPLTLIEFLDPVSQLPVDTDTVWIKPNGIPSGDTLDTINNLPDTVYANTFDTVFVIPSSGPGVLWTGNDVYVNNAYHVLPPSYGVATFDGLDSLGMPHAPLSQTGSQGIADILTSAPIDLLNNPFGGVYTVADSVYLSFYYQPQGLGEIPEPQDSLVLEFYDVDQNEWVFQWKAEGEALKPFEKVFVKIQEGRFFRDGFRFRFKNYASLNGAFDHWNLDYVELDINRAGAPSVALDDVAFVSYGESIIKEYTKMPWSHFKTNPALFMEDTSMAVAYNNFNTNKNVRFGVQVYEQGQQVFTTDFNQNVEPIFAPQTTLEKSIDISPFVFSDTSNAKRYTFDVLNVLNTTPDVNSDNDTLLYEQDFGTFYAYDDGTAENGYYLVSAGAQLAVEFNSPLPDSLRAVNIYFPESGEDITNRLFRIKVWASLVPEVVLYEGLVENPLYSFDRNRVVRYDIDPVEVGGRFYIGYEQLTDPIILGYDRNKNARTKTFYSINGTWSPASFLGAVMIHPEFDTVYYPWKVNVPEVLDEANLLRAYPNPAQDEVTVTWAGADAGVLEVFDLQGRKVRSYLPILPNTPLIINGLSEGMYILRFMPDSGEDPQTLQLIMH